MKLLKYFIIVHVLIPGYVEAQNLISNPGFEGGSYNANDFACVNFDSNLDSWKGRLDINGQGYWHSPDWCCSMCDDGCDITYAYAGDYYVKMSDYELIQQKISAGFESGKHYHIKLMVKVTDLGNDFSDLKFYVAKLKMKYINESPFLGGSECDENYMKHKSQPFQNYDAIHTFDLEQYPTFTWFELEFVYNTPFENFNGYNWFIIEVFNEGDWNSNGYISCHILDYLCIDNVSIEEVDYCTLDPCSRLDGDMIPIANNTLWTPQTPFFITNLNNIYSATNIELNNLYGSLVRSYSDIFSVNGIQFPIYFDGENDAGSPVAAGIYFFKMDLTNDCGIGTTEIPFEVISPGTATIPPTPNINNSVVTPLPCCAEQPDIYIENVTIYGEGAVDYIATDNIIIASNSPVLIEDDVNSLLFQAGNSILFYPGFYSEQGAHYSAIINPCTPQANFLFLPDTGQIVIDTTQQQTDTTIINNNSEKNAGLMNDKGMQDILLYPNPCNGKFVIFSNNGINSISVSISELSGHPIVSEKKEKGNKLYVDISNQAKGIYLVRIDNGNCSIIKQLIYQ